MLIVFLLHRINPHCLVPTPEGIQIGAIAVPLDNIIDIGEPDPVDPAKSKAEVDVASRTKPVKVALKVEDMFSGLITVAGLVGRSIQQMLSEWRLWAQVCGEPL